jgi:protein-S-isoprenylcysteine O-methyltransferase Ste14
MGVFTLACFSAFLLAAFGWRSWLQYRLTGDTGLRRPGRGSGALEWSAWLLLLAGGATSFLAALLAAAGRLRAVAPAEQPGAALLGAGCLLAGFACTLVAQFQMGPSWRVGVDPRERTALVQHGVFARVRNPIFSSMLLGLLGVALLVPHGLAWLGLLLVFAGIELQVRGVEEPYLLRAHGDAYRAYAGRVGRFLPGVGCLR